MLVGRILHCLLIAVFAVSAPTPAYACVDVAEYDETAFLEADLIFVGELTGYELVTAEDHGFPRDLAVLTFEVTEVLKGKAGRTIRLWWPNSTFGHPPTLGRYAATLVAADANNAADRKGAVSFQFPSIEAIQSMPVVYQQPCTSEAIFPVSQTDIVTIKRWITAGEADGTELSYDGFKVVDELPARRTAQVNLLPIGGGAVGVGALILAILRRRRRRKADGPPAG